MDRTLYTLAALDEAFCKQEENGGKGLKVLPYCRLCKKQNFKAYVTFEANFLSTLFNGGFHCWPFSRIYNSGSKIATLGDNLIMIPLASIARQFMNHNDIIAFETWCSFTA